MRLPNDGRFWNSNKEGRKEQCEERYPTRALASLRAFSFRGILRIELLDAPCQHRLDGSVAESRALPHQCQCIADPFRRRDIHVGRPAQLTREGEFYASLQQRFGEAISASLLKGQPSAIICKTYGVLPNPQPKTIGKGDSIVTVMPSRRNFLQSCAALGLSAQSEAAAASPPSPAPPSVWTSRAEQKRKLSKDVVWTSHEPIEFLLRRGEHFDNEPEIYERMYAPENLKRMAAAGDSLWPPLFL